MSEIVSPEVVHRLRRLRSRRNPGLQRAGLRSFIDKIEAFELALDPENIGQDEKWFLPNRKKFNQTVEVGPIELLPAFSPSTNRKTVVWYRKVIQIGEPKPGKHYKLNFARAFYATKVWGNGVLLTDVDGHTEHISGFSSFSYDLTDFLDSNGKIEIVVRVENSDDPAVCRGKQWSTQYARQGIWYGQATGLWGQVTLEEVSANRLRSDVTGYADPDSGLIRLQAITYISEVGTYQLQATLENAEGQEQAQFRRQLNLTPGQQSHELVFAIPDPRPWSIASPYLYRVEVNLRREGELLDKVFFEIGFRSVKAKGNQLFLNDTPLYLNGVLYQPYLGDSYTLSYEELKADLEYTCKTIGANLLRIHIAGADSLPLYLADRLGLLVWVEVPSPHISNDTSRANHRRELESLVRQIDTHPCVAFISIYNESWGCQDIGEDSPAGEATRAYIKEAYQYIKQMRPDILVVDNDGWEHISENKQLPATDFISLHTYINDLGEWEKDIAEVAKLLEPDSPRYQQLTGHPAIVGDKSYHYQNEKPLILSEWGGFGALYGGPEAQQAKFELIRRYKAVLAQHQATIAGDCYTQLGDVEQETNGLLDKTRKRLNDATFLQSSANLLAEPGK